MQKEAAENKLCEFVPAVCRAAAAAVSAATGMQIEPSDVRLPGKRGDVSVSLGSFSEKDSGCIKKAEPGNIPKIDGISVFSGDMHLIGQSAVLELNDALLAHYSRICSAALDLAALPDRIAIPEKGIPADGEALHYAEAMLLARSKTGKPHIPCSLSREALIRCLALTDQTEKKLRAALAAAVRSALSACAAGKAGGEEALAMAKLLAFAGNKIR